MRVPSHSLSQVLKWKGERFFYQAAHEAAGNEASLSAPSESGFDPTLRMGIFTQ